MKKLNFDILTLLKKHCDVTKTLEHCYKKMNVDKNCAVAKKNSYALQKHWRAVTKRWNIVEKHWFVAKKFWRCYKNVGALLQKDEKWRRMNRAAIYTHPNNWKFENNRFNNETNSNLKIQRKFYTLNFLHADQKRL